MNTDLDIKKEIKPTTGDIPLAYETSLVREKINSLFFQKNYFPLYRILYNNPSVKRIAAKITANTVGIAANHALAIENKRKELKEAGSVIMKLNKSNAYSRTKVPTIDTEEDLVLACEILHKYYLLDTLYGTRFYCLASLAASSCDILSSHGNETSFTERTLFNILAIGSAVASIYYFINYSMNHGHTTDSLPKDRAAQVLNNPCNINKMSSIGFYLYAIGFGLYAIGLTGNKNPLITCGILTQIASCILSNEISYYLTSIEVAHRLEDLREQLTESEKLLAGINIEFKPWRSSDQDMDADSPSVSSPAIREIDNPAPSVSSPAIREIDNPAPSVSSPAIREIDNPAPSALIPAIAIILQYIDTTHPFFISKSNDFINNYLINSERGKIVEESKAAAADINNTHKKKEESPSTEIGAEISTDKSIQSTDLDKLSSIFEVDQ